MRTTTLIAALVAASAITALGVACTGESPTEAASLTTAHDDMFMGVGNSEQAQAQYAELRQWLAPLHNPAKAAAAGYTALFGCIDETTVGVSASNARGMGYHVTAGNRDIVGDGVISVTEPEFLVYAPAENDAALAPEDRLAAARLVAVEYFVPGTTNDEFHQPADILGGSFVWVDRFQGWARHVWVFGHNPAGINDNWNTAVRLCTDAIPFES
ncbi:MAG TPA: hypothetical protein VFO96_00675 [Gemmatimonadales bacterium]|jgi:hypothetical protein|nr:hypothetical protein [Gemmatimonadales bacterium]